MPNDFPSELSEGYPFLMRGMSRHVVALKDWPSMLSCCFSARLWLPFSKHSVISRCYLFVHPLESQQAKSLLTMLHELSPSLVRICIYWNISTFWSPLHWLCFVFRLALQKPCFISFHSSSKSCSRILITLVKPFHRKLCSRLPLIWVQ